MAQKARSQRARASRPQRPSQSRGNGSRPAELSRIESNDANREYKRYVHLEDQDPAGAPDVLLDVPELRIDSIHLEVDDLDAHVALKAKVLNLVKLNVGLDVHLSQLKLDVKGLEAQIVLKARLDHVAAIVDRLMTSLDRNPELVQGLSRAVSEVGQGAGEAVGETGDAVKDVGKGAESALGDVGQGAGQAVGDVGQGAGQAVGDVGQGAGQAVGNLDQLVGGVGQTVGEVGQGAGQAVGGVGQAVGGASPNGQSGDGAAEARPSTLAKEVARLVAHAASDEARDLSLAATRKVRELGERREQRRADKHHATDAAVRLADELGVDLEEIEGTGREGRVTVNDVREAQEA